MTEGKLPNGVGNGVVVVAVIVCSETSVKRQGRAR